MLNAKIFKSFDGNTLDKFNRFVGPEVPSFIYIFLMRFSKCLVGKRWNRIVK